MKRSKINKTCILSCLICFTLFNLLNAQNYEIIEQLEITNFMKLDSIYLNDFKNKKLDCFEKIKEYDKNTFELYESCFENVDITVFVNGEKVFKGLTKGKYNNLGGQLLFKSINKEDLKFPLKIKILYHDYYKKICFTVPKMCKRVVVKSYLNDKYPVSNLVEINLSVMSYLYYLHFVSSCKSELRKGIILYLARQSQKR